jgi:hypothetical protein
VPMTVELLSKKECKQLDKILYPLAPWPFISEFGISISEVKG